jgi:nucleoside phosphorylase
MREFGISKFEPQESAPIPTWKLDVVSGRQVILVYGKQTSENADGLVNEAIMRWRPGIVLVVGICALADPKKQSRGDICVATSTIGGAHTSGTGGTEFRGELAGGLESFRLGDKVDIDGTWRRVHYGTFVTVPHKVKNSVIRDEYASRCRSVHGDPVAIDMEANGIGQLILSLPADSRPSWACIKSVSDLADGVEDKKPEVKAEQQDSAASNAARAALLGLRALLTS